MQKEDRFWRDAAMPYVEVRCASNSRACYKPHMHESACIGAVDAGSSVLMEMGVGQRAQRIEPATVVWIPARQRHACNPLPGQAWSFQMLYLDAQWLHSSCAALAPDAQWCQGPGIRLSRTPSLYAQLCASMQLLGSAAPVQHKRAALSALLGACHSAAWQSMSCASGALAVSEQLQQVLQKVQSAPWAALDWQQEARSAGMSRTQLIRAFRRITGMTPHAWQQNWRINVARGQLQRGAALAQVAYEQGFADQAHFQRVFKALTGTTPGNYRA